MIHGQQNVKLEMLPGVALHSVNICFVTVNKKLVVTQ
jgi:hypothetical protein